VWRMTGFGGSLGVESERVWRVTGYEGGITMFLTIVFTL
jgi:hypothetical protein